ncbi:MAG TPA: hypothetical protein VFG76_07900 [Candidatus Polarisedimenticolia bacterium]|nr:hypothetical protein [Candidatus Polarisedimenticolia bacterium]
MTTMRGRLITLLVFAAAMAFVEAAVVVYLRALYYPEGFSFPLKGMSPEILAIELAREASTIVMLVAVSLLSGSDRWERFLHFAAAFGMWDIFYYVWLYVALGWPASLLDWDILFLIPVPWIAPVLAPVIVSASLIAGSLILLSLKRRGVTVRVSPSAWWLGVAAGALVLASFMTDWRSVVEGRPPQPYPWALFLAGETLGLGALAWSVRRMRAPARR